MPPQTALRQGRQKIKPASRSEIEYVRISEEEARTDEDSLLRLQGSAPPEHRQRCFIS